ncbi:ABC transporter permease [Shouchella clausii]|uniref:ABC transporter permease n=1 Tax=Shouchella clausii TaxID=79880 RepID=UPI000B96887C|nr:ABC transporter permease [Shouchella clausii]AST95757.1 sulfonate ABC transporter permease [Shouchella clausii]MCR1288975.1 ABC transporter permease [Shouchella clausii]MEB5472164.1 ABC transporter permease [Shouchella clausii]QNM42111.1 ABC transporter permease [Shouchella clausii]WQG95055.1 ABC transporter permease [Shouchella clausii]
MLKSKIGAGLISFVFVIGAWQLVIWIGGYQEALLPSPLAVGRAIFSLIEDGTLFTHLQVSLFRFFIGYITAVLTGIILGLILGRTPKVWAVADPIVQVLRPVAPVAWTPFIVLWFGIGNIPAIAIIFIAAFFPVLLTTVSAVRKVPDNYLKTAINLEIRGPTLLWKVIFPASFPSIANGLHIAVGTAWIFLVAGEMVGAQSGLGYLIIDSRNALDLDFVVAGIVFIGLLGLALDKGVGSIERAILKQWGGVY